MISHITYLVGSPHAMTEYLRRRGVPAETAFVQRVQSPQDLGAGFTWDQVIFLSDWQTLIFQREMYNAVIGRKGQWSTGWPV